MICRLFVAFKLVKKILLFKHLLALSIAATPQYVPPAEPPRYLPMHFVIDASLYGDTPSTFRFLTDNKTMILVTYEHGKYTVTVRTDAKDKELVKVKKEKDL